MTTSGDNYTFRKATSSTAMSLSEVATKLGVSIQRCSRMIKRLQLPVLRVGYLILVEPSELSRLKKEFQLRKKKAK